MEKQKNFILKNLFIFFLNKSAYYSLNDYLELKCNNCNKKAFAKFQSKWKLKEKGLWKTFKLIYFVFALKRLMELSNSK